MMATRQALLARLGDGAEHSGQALAAEFGISRAAVAKHIRRLRDLGWSIHARRGFGYRLPAAHRPLERAVLASALEPLGTAVADLELLDEVDSTNSRLERAPTPPPGTVRLCIAETQRAGRGRRGRAWASGPGRSITFSASRGFDRSPVELGALGLAVGVAVAETLRANGLDGVGVKWPNDVVHAGAKLGGILIEVQGETAGRSRAIVGIGVNHQRPGDVEESDRRGIVDAASRAVPGRAALAGALMRATAEALARFDASGFAAFRDRFNDLDILQGRPVRAWTTHATIDGIARGIATDGALLFEDEAGHSQHLHSAEVTIRARE